ncbi:MAG TPA: hypothetical protein VHM70_22990 [Polyangiaceae bacterium]|jgi:hypothetical protein|nr:hypothetical protein [Polyangiaceae bacterium]
MCKSLATECAGFSSKRLQACQQIGTRGLSHPVDEDVCFVLYDTCIDECRFYNEFPPPDGGTDAGDAEAPDSGEVDSGRANSP